MHSLVMRPGTCAGMQAAAWVWHKQKASSTATCLRYGFATEFTNFRVYESSGVAS